MARRLALPALAVCAAACGGVARFALDVNPGTYRAQVFLASDGPRQATFTLAVTHP